MQKTAQDAQIEHVREQIDRARAGGKPVRYPVTVKKQVAALRAAGIPALRLAAEFKLAGSQIHQWCKCHREPAAQVFDVREPSAGPMKTTDEAERLRLRIGAFELTIVVRSNP